MSKKKENLKGKKVNPEILENPPKPEQPTIEDYRVVLTLAQQAAVPLNQSLNVLRIIQKVADYHGVK
jgi:hypothetical protein